MTMKISIFIYFLCKKILKYSYIILSFWSFRTFSHLEHLYYYYKIKILIGFWFYSNTTIQQKEKNFKNSMTRIVWAVDKANSAATRLSQLVLLLQQGPETLTVFCDWQWNPNCEGWRERSDPWRPSGVNTSEMGAWPAVSPSLN